MSYFIDGLKDATRKEISYQTPDTFEQAWKLAIRFDIAMYKMGQSKGNRQGYLIASFRKGYNNNISTRKLDHFGSSSSYSSSSQGNNYHICKKPGHWKWECSQRNQGNYNNNYNSNYNNNHNHNKGNNNKGNNNKGNNNGYKGKGKFNSLEDTTSSSSSFNYNNNLKLTNTEDIQERLL